MGLLQNGEWVDRWYDTEASDGAFKRQDSAFRNQVEADPDARFPAASGRYHLFVSLACPWAHRTLIFRQIKDLSEHIAVSAVDPLMLENGWQFGEGDPLHGDRYLYQKYLRADPGYEGRVTVPVLWDTETDSIVSNESADIIRMFNSAFNDLTGNTADYYPEPLREAIDAVNARVYSDINNGVYKTGFATRQSVYATEFQRVFAALDWVETLLEDSDFLVAGQLTEADWRLFTTLVRFDAVYHGHFKLNRQRLSEFANISAYVRRLAAIPGITATINLEHIKQHYYGSHAAINPTGVVPLGPATPF